MLMYQKAIFHVCCPHPRPLSLREQCLSHREREHIGALPCFSSLHRALTWAVSNLFHYKTPCVPPVTPPPPSPTGGGELSGGYPSGGWQIVCRFGFRFTCTLSAQVYVSGDRQWDKFRFAMFGRRRCLDVKSLTLPPPQPFLALRASCSSPAAGFALRGRGISLLPADSKQAPRHRFG